MNKLSIEKRAQILRCLTEGNSMRATARLVDVAFNSVRDVLIEAGKRARQFEEQHIRGLQTKRLQLDEVWCFVASKNRNTPAERKAIGHGDASTWTCLDPDSKLIVSWRVGARDTDNAIHLLYDARDRIATERVQITSDQLSIYINTVHAAFMGDADYAMICKSYAWESASSGRCSPAKMVGCSKRYVSGNPDPAHISTSFVERSNLTLRIQNRRFTRLTNAFSKKLANLEHSVALFTFAYNFTRVHKTLRCTPAMEAGCADHIWTMEEFLRWQPAQQQLAA